jgi:flavorubredoxin
VALKKIKEGIYYLGAIDWDRRLFDELIPLPDGTSYNTYLIEGSEKIALLDTVDPTKEKELISDLKKLGIERIDYLISHHAEQDHSGTIPKLLELYPQALIVTNKRCKEFLMDLLVLSEERFKIINDGETLCLGNKTLKFIFAPWVHWPETMLSYLEEDRVLFSCDLFGSHYATSNLFANEEETIYKAAKRYYAEIMMPFRTSIKKHLNKINGFSVDFIAPSHGPIYNKPTFILNAYREWVCDEIKNEVIIPYVSMHGSTEKMVSYFIDALMERGIVVKPFNLTKTDIGELAIFLVDAASLVIASPTVLTGPHPLALYATYLTNMLRPKLRFVSLIGSYGWAGKMKEELLAMLGNLKVEVIEPVIVKGHPKEEDFRTIDRLADEILKRHKQQKGILIKNIN